MPLACQLLFKFIINRLLAALIQLGLHRVQVLVQAVYGRQLALQHLQLGKHLQLPGVVLELLQLWGG